MTGFLDKLAELFKTSTPECALCDHPGNTVHLSVPYDADGTVNGRPHLQAHSCAEHHDEVERLIEMGVLR